MSASKLVKKVFSGKPAKKDWAPISMMAKFVRERDLVKFEESQAELLVHTQTPAAVTGVEESAKAVVASEAVKSDVIEIKDYEDNSDKEKTKPLRVENNSTEQDTVIYL